MLYLHRYLPHALRSTDDSICLFVKDENKFAREYDDSVAAIEQQLARQNIDYVDKVFEAICFGRNLKSCVNVVAQNLGSIYLLHDCIYSLIFFADLKNSGNTTQSAED